MIKSMLGRERRLTAEVVNFGLFNQILALRTYDNPPFAIMPVSRPSTPERVKSLGVDLKEETTKDYGGLKLVGQRAEDLESRVGHSIFIPTVGSFSLEKSRDGQIVAMVNEVVGVKKSGQNHWGSNEVNIHVMVLPTMGRKGVFILNNATALNQSRFRRYYEIEVDAYSGSTKDINKLLDMSDKLAAGYVAAIVQIWFLTGCVPDKFLTSAGDGVYDGSAIPPEDDFKERAAPIRLITMRNGLTDKPSIDLPYQKYEIDLKTLEDLRTYLSLLYEAGPFKRQEEAYGKIEVGEPYRLFLSQQIETGIEVAFERLFGQDGRALNDLRSGREIQEIWKDLGLKWSLPHSLG